MQSKHSAKIGVVGSMFFIVPAFFVLVVGRAAMYPGLLFWRSC